MNNAKFALKKSKTNASHSHAITPSVMNVFSSGCDKSKDVLFAIPRYFLCYGEK